jgi:hypothetical protein
MPFGVRPFRVALAPPSGDRVSRKRRRGTSSSLSLRLERLIEAKEFANRPKDVAVLPALRATLSLSQRRRSE